MEAKFSNRVKEVISLSREEALRLGHDYIGTEHLLLGVIREGEGVAIGLLKKLGISLEDLRASVEHNTKNTTSSNLKNVTNIPLTRQTEKVLKITYLEAKIFKSKLIGTEHLLLSILRDEDNIATTASYIFSGKTSYLEQSSKLLYNYIDTNGLPFNFTDLFGKISINSANGSKINFFGFNYNDRVRYKAVSDLNWDSWGIGSRSRPGRAPRRVDPFI